VSTSYTSLPHNTLLSWTSPHSLPFLVLFFFVILIFPSLNDPNFVHLGQITATVNAFKRSIDDYDAMAKKEMIDAKREKAFA
jgi:hypothetical protein